LISYADFITLLFAFFVVMYSVSSVNEGKYRVLSDALVAAFRSSAKSLSPIQVGHSVRTPYSPQYSFRRAPSAVNIPNMPTPSGGKNTRLAIEIRRIADQLESAMAGLIDKKLVKVTRKHLSVEVEINNKVLFESGSATVSSDAVPVVKKLAEILRRNRYPLRVEGYTDNWPIRTNIYPSNWELSAGRAANVVHLLASERVKPERMAAVGYGQFHPVTSNDTAEGRSENRRVVIVIEFGTEASNDLSPRIAGNEDGVTPVGALLGQASQVELQSPFTPATMVRGRPRTDSGEPVDVTDQDFIERGAFPVINLPPISVNAAPMDSRKVLSQP
jgi:chemotaxis protein MotB